MNGGRRVGYESYNHSYLYTQFKKSYITLTYILFILIVFH